MIEHLVEFEMDGSVAIVRLNRPQAMNAMTGQLMVDLMAIQFQQLV